ncbi:hypothetical protein O6H91_19G057200 [Diphasiastrum complanatum]|uniref:Uncharacterized protein n=1 Tax=Diphasiastrum complanatum TaxID=34168 RepID=A0ACC2AWS9_DIPCM|nr:hypothetical protein O6H91_19G057200 [Diphasiastrum complanatum]
MEKPTEKTDLPEGESEKRQSQQIIVQSDLVYAPKHHFLPGKTKEIIGQVLREKLTGATYDGEAAASWVREIADSIKVRLKDFGFERYKIVVQAVIGERRGQSLQMACRCFWDPITDGYAENTFVTGQLFGVAVAFGMYLC